MKPSTFRIVQRFIASESVRGPHSKKRYTAVWVPLPRQTIDDRWAYADSEGLPGCWSYEDESKRGPGIGSAEDRHPTSKAALKAAVELDLLVAARGGPLTREEYEDEAKRLGIRKIFSDRECLSMLDGDWDISTYGVKGAAERTLAGRRGGAFKKETHRPITRDERAELDLLQDIQDLEERAQDAEDRGQINRASELRAKADALRSS